MGRKEMTMPKEVSSKTISEVPLQMFSADDVDTMFDGSAAKLASSSSRISAVVVAANTVAPKRNKKPYLNELCIVFTASVCEHPFYSVFMQSVVSSHDKMNSYRKCSTDV